MQVQFEVTEQQIWRLLYRTATPCSLYRSHCLRH